MNTQLAEINAQADQLGSFIGAYCAAHPLLPRKKVVESLMSRLMGSIAPQWAREQYGPSGWCVSLGDVRNAGVFCVYYYRDPESQKVMALVQRRKEPLDEKEFRIGAVGGYANPAEKSFEAIARETQEEVCDDKGEPIFTPKFFNYTHLFNDVDTTARPPISYDAYCYELSKEEYTSIQSHIDKLNSDPHYKKNVMEASHDEVNNLEFLPLEEMASRIKRSLFTYPRQHDAYIATQRGILSDKPLEGIFHRDPGMDGYVSH